jgi:hypothetical protein
LVYKSFLSRPDEFSKKRYKIAFLHEHPVGLQEIAKRVRCSITAAHYWVEKYCENCDLSTAGRMGQLHATMVKQHEKIVKMAEKKHNITATGIQTKMEEWVVEISVATM